MEKSVLKCPFVIYNKNDSEEENSFMDEMPVNNVSTADTAEQPVETEQPVTETPVAEEAVAAPERTWTKDQIVEMMKKRVARSHNAFFKRYGVQDLKELDELFENSKKFSSMNDEFGKIQLKNSELMRENAFLRNNINPDKYNDIIAYFKGNNMDFSEEELLKVLPTHNEWLKQTAPVTTISSLGSEAHTLPKPDESVLAGKLLGVKF